MTTKDNDDVGHIVVRKGGHLRVTVHDARECYFYGGSEAVSDGVGGFRMEFPRSGSDMWLHDKPSNPLRDKIDGLECDLDSALEVIAKLCNGKPLDGGAKWLRMNYPGHKATLSLGTPAT